MYVATTSFASVDVSSLCVVELYVYVLCVPSGCVILLISDLLAKAYAYVVFLPRASVSVRTLPEVS